MATIFRARKKKNEGSGGKIMRQRRGFGVRTPYEYTPPCSSPCPIENPNWLLGMVSPAARVIVGAGKMISTVFFPDSPPYSSSSEDDSSDDDDSRSSQRDERLNQSGATPEANKYHDQELPLIVQKNEAKLAIEQLIMQETFSRDECNRLVEIIESRVMECPSTKESKDESQSVLADRARGSSIAAPGASQSDWQAGKLPAAYSYLGNGFDSPSRASALGGYSPDICNTAVMEAKKWLEEKKMASYSKLDKSQGTFTSNPYMLSDVTDGEAGSPVLVAKSYMKSRPLWSSPTLGHIGFQTPSPIGMHLLKEEAPYSFGANAFSSSKDWKWNSHAVDSLNTLDGTRRVCFKSSEDILQPLSAKHDSYLAISSGFPVYGGSRNEALSTSAAIRMTDHNQDLEGVRTTMEERCTTLFAHEDRVADSVSETHNGPPDLSAVVVGSESKVMASDGIKTVLQSSFNCSPSNDSPGIIDPKEFSTQSEGMQVKESSQPHQFSDLKETNPFDDPRSQEILATKKEVNGSRDRGAANGFALASRLSPRVNEESDLRPNNEDDPNLISSSDGKLSTGIQEACELLSEASVEVPINEETDSIASGSLNSSSRHSKDLLPTDSQSISSHGMKKRFSTRIEKQVVKKIGRYSRRGRGRGN